MMGISIRRVFLTLAGVLVVCMAVVIALRTQDPQQYLVAARKLVQQGKPADAIQSLQHYIALKPQNPIGYIEMGYAFEAECKQIGCPMALSAIKQGGVTLEHMKTAAEDGFQSAQWEYASAWYLRALREAQVQGASVSYGLFYQTTIASALAHSPEAGALIGTLQLTDPAFVVPEVVTETRVNGGDLRWLVTALTEAPAGKTLKTNLAELPPNMGVMWWNGVAGVLLHMPADGTYQVNIKLQNSAPPLVHLIVEMDGKPMKEILLEKGDNSISTISFPVQLPAGYHLVALRYDNDEMVDGQDRNAMIDSIMIARQE